jgi:inward rectifier potassium channel
MSRIGKRNHSEISNTGFDTTTNQSGGRVLSKEGQSNVQKTGLSYFQQMSLYHTLIEMSISHFLSICILAFILINFIFGSIYYALNPIHIGIDASHSWSKQFIECIFFSAQTITTVGYGRVNPQSIPTGIVASLEAFIGLLSFAVLTGLIYGRFSRPRAYLKFSHNALISPYKDGKAIMLRMASYKNNSLTDLEANVLIGMRNSETDSAIVNYYPCKLELASITALALSWTLVHYMNEDSPFFEMTMEDFKKKKVEILVFIKGFDEHFSNIVKAKTSYHYSEIIEHAKFNLMFKKSDDGQMTILELDRINDYSLLKS